jgi:hypothetical protein
MPARPWREILEDRWKKDGLTAEQIAQRHADRQAHTARIIAGESPDDVFELDHADRKSL